ncbi:hypothetical protein G6Z92_06270 [Vibrio aestuarianus subsp. cardii]|uniref:hypothetical protein n=1 Tax=Vibrio aestuarianus TaxID=28171 RepID=UPI0015C57045|nr:hypothetical protein [Vibrio aestuarianus]NGZ66590.1 hypothetical protein [Vibrio aestuarianus subsp. cardii]
MFDLLKLALLAAGCIALYGLATGADLNTLFADTIAKIEPALEAGINGFKEFIVKILSKNS